MLEILPEELWPMLLRLLQTYEPSGDGEVDVHLKLELGQVAAFTLSSAHRPPRRRKQKP